MELQQVSVLSMERREPDCFQGLAGPVFDFVAAFAGLLHHAHLPMLLTIERLAGSGMVLRGFRGGFVPCRTRSSTVSKPSALTRTQYSPGGKRVPGT